MKKLIFIAAAVFSLTSCMIKTEKKIRTITVSGTGTVQVENKEADLVLSVVSRNEDVVKASEENAERMNAVMRALTESGVGSDSMHTTDYSIWQESHDYGTSKKNVMTYVVSNRIHVNVRNVIDTGRIIDSAIKAGANQMNSLSYSAGNTSEAEKQARILAIRDAEQKANTLVTTSGLTLGHIVNMQESQGGYIERSNYVRLDAKAMATPISSGSTNVSVSVEVTYEIK